LRVRASGILGEVEGKENQRRGGVRGESGKKILVLNISTG